MEKLKENKLYKLVIPFAIAFLFLFTERSLKGIALFEFSYIAINLHTWIAIGCSWLIIVLFVIKKRKLADWTTIIGYSAVFACYALSTLLNRGNMSRWFDTFIYSVPSIMLVGLAEDKKQLFRGLSWLYLAVSVLNIAFYFIPSLWSFAFEWHEEYFIGFQNGVGWPLVLGMLFCLLDYSYSKKPWKLITYIVCFIINQYIVWCATAMVGAMIIACYLVFPFVRRLFEKWDFIVFLAVAVAAFAVLVFLFEYIMDIPPVRYLLEDVLGKDTTMSGRTYVWAEFRKAIAESPVIGHGFSDSAAVVYEPSIWNHGMVHAHNEWLQTLYEGGIITLLAGLSFVAIIGRKIKSGICKMILFTLLIMLQADMISYYSWYLTAFVLEVGLIENTQYD